jgi:hypothetical protein
MYYEGCAWADMTRGRVVPPVVLGPGKKLVMPYRLGTTCLGCEWVRSLGGRHDAASMRGSCHASTTRPKSQLFVQPYVRLRTRMHSDFAKACAFRGCLVSTSNDKPPFRRTEHNLSAVTSPNSALGAISVPNL